MRLISHGNLKLGVLPSFSLPPMKTCPGKTPFCKRYCFGFHGNYVWGNSARISNERRLEASKTVDFVSNMIAEISPLTAPAFRVHVVGDFYAVRYIQRWLKIVRTFPDIHFFGSTRSWRVPKLVEAITQLRDEPNVYMRASVDFTDNLAPDATWSTWSVEGRGEVCPHDLGRVLSCYVCGRCWNDREANTKFQLRWGDMEYLCPPILKGGEN